MNRAEFLAEARKMAQGVHSSQTCAAENILAALENPDRQVPDDGLDFITPNRVGEFKARLKAQIEAAEALLAKDPKQAQQILSEVSGKVPEETAVYAGATKITYPFIQPRMQAFALHRVALLQRTAQDEEGARRSWTRAFGALRHEHPVGV